MATISDYVLDAALAKLDTEADRLDITSQEATTYAEATSTYTLGHSTSLSFGAHFAIVDVSASRLLAAGSLTTPQSVTSGNSFTIAAFDVEIPDPA